MPVLDASLCKPKATQGSSRDVVVAWVGRTAFIKQPGMFLRAAAVAADYLRRRLGSPRRRVRFRMFGKGPLDSSLPMLAAHLGLPVAKHCDAVASLDRAQCVDRTASDPASEREEWAAVAFEGWVPRQEMKRILLSEAHGAWFSASFG